MSNEKVACGDCEVNLPTAPHRPRERARQKAGYIWGLARPCAKNHHSDPSDRPGIHDGSLSPTLGSNRSNGVPDRHILKRKLPCGRQQIRTLLGETRGFHSRNAEATYRSLIFVRVDRHSAKHRSYTRRDKPPRLCSLQSSRCNTKGDFCR